MISSGGKAKRWNVTGLLFVLPAILIVMIYAVRVINW